MKKLLITSTLALLATAWSMVGAKDYPAEYLGLPGDNLNLYATLKLFQESETLESFERSLNDEKSRINNLDLNGDNYIDYIMVIDYVDGDNHSIVLRAALNKDETQDVAVFTVQRLRDGSVQVQLVGDEALYGRNYIIEPIYADSGETPNPGYIGNARNNSNVAVVRTTTYEVAAWPVVRYIYLPTYTSWHSSWYWGYYPSYWNPWRPFYWHTYYGYHYNYHNHYYGHYRAWNYNRCNNYNNFYYNNVRTYSSVVNYRIKSGHYNTTYSRPDLRKDGEALYARTNSGHNARTRDNVSVDGRSANAGQSRSIEGNRSGVERSSTTNVTRRTDSGSSVNQGTENTRKSATAGNSRNVESNSAEIATDVSRRVSNNASTRFTESYNADRETNTSRKSADVTNNRKVKSTTVGQSNGNAPRSSANVSNRNVSRNQEAPRSVSSRSSSGQSQTKSAVSSGSSSGQSRSSVSSGGSGNQSRSSVSSGNSGSSSRSTGSSSNSGRSSSSGNSGRR
jgi:hypothetical protein